MARTPREVVVRVTAGEPIREWCDRCLTSSVLVFPVLIAVAGNKPDRPCGTVRLCARCDVEEEGTDE